MRQYTTWHPGRIYYARAGHSPGIGRQDNASILLPADKQGCSMPLVKAVEAQQPLRQELLWGAQGSDG